MKSPFPGMDPFLEGHLWPDVHDGLAFLIKEQLVPKVSPNYLVRTSVYTVKDTQPNEDIGIMYPDAYILKKPERLEEPDIAYSSLTTDIPTPPSLTLIAEKPIEVKVPVIEIKDRKNNKLITAIEILSPVNKRSIGLDKYRAKRVRLNAEGVHLLEIDLLRRGIRPIINRNLPTAHYIISLTKANAPETDIWAIDIKDKLPIVPVPLLPNDSPVNLDLNVALIQLYKRSSYHLDINYNEPPPPPKFTEVELNWIKNLSRNK